MALVVVGCLVFLFSVIFPFYHVSTFMGLEGYQQSTNYWSYKYDYYWSYFLFGSHFGSSQQWFSDYWFAPYSASSLGLSLGLGIPWILLPMFIIQVLTLLFGVAFIIFNRRILGFAPVLLGLLTIALMVYVGMFPYGVGISGTYQLGFYLVFPSLFLFLSAFALNELTKKQQTSACAHLS